MSHLLGKAGQPHAAVEREEAGRRRGQQPAIAGVLHRVAELHPARRNVAHPATDPDGIIVPGGLPVFDRYVADRQAQSGQLEIPITHAAPAKMLGSGDVEPDQIAGMVDHAHLVGLGIVDPNLRFRDCRYRSHEDVLMRCIFGAVLGHTLVVVSDAHLGVAPPATEEALLEFLDAVPTLGDCLLVNGDLFDFWFTYARVIPRRGFHVAAALARLRRRLPIVMVGGNHDRWDNDFWERDLGLDFHPNGPRSRSAGARSWRPTATA